MTSLYAPLDDGDVVELHRIAAAGSARLYKAAATAGPQSRTPLIAAARDMASLADDARAELAARRTQRKDTP